MSPTPSAIFLPTILPPRHRCVPPCTATFRHKHNLYNHLARHHKSDTVKGQTAHALRRMYVRKAYLARRRHLKGALMNVGIAEIVMLSAPLAIIGEHTGLEDGIKELTV